MKYDFDTVINRRNTGSLKWDIKDNEHPMWVADMDFRVAPEIIEALSERVNQGVFGYSIIPDEWYDAYINWWDTKHSYKMEKENLIFSLGVVPSISSIVRKLTTPNENVLIQTPVYNIFFNSIVNNGARVLENELLYDGKAYHIDFDDLEAKLRDPQTSLMILCNPQNPVGKIWTREELAHIGRLAAKYHVTVISDEVHCDIAEPGYEYVPFASVDETCKDISITCIAPTKCFNIAGLHTSAVYISNDVLRHKVWRALNTDELAEPNAFSVIGAVAAFNRGGEWNRQFNEYISNNRKLVTDYINKNIPEIEVVEGHATYLLWLDCGNCQVPGQDLAEFIREKTGLYLASGEEYGRCGKNFMRMNIAMPKSEILKGLELLKTGISLAKAEA